MSAPRPSWSGTARPVGRRGIAARTREAANSRRSVASTRRAGRRGSSPRTALYPWAPEISDPGEPVRAGAASVPRGMGRPAAWASGSLPARPRGGQAAVADAPVSRRPSIVLGELGPDAGRALGAATLPMERFPLQRHPRCTPPPRPGPAGLGPLTVFIRAFYGLFLYYIFTAFRGTCQGSTATRSHSS